ncbi:MAG TPA: hypothetical protein VIL72_09990 [Beijerinckiaceae bacterium]
MTCNLRMQPSLKRALERAAADEERSTTGLIEKVLKDFLREKSLWPPAGQARTHAAGGQGGAGDARTDDAGMSHP